MMKNVYKGSLLDLNPVTLLKRNDFEQYGLEVNIFPYNLWPYAIKAGTYLICLCDDITISYQIIGDENKQKRMCQLRRFQDGTIKETVTIKISSWGAYANDFILDKIVHLVSVHFDNVEAQILRGNKLQVILASHIT